MFLMHCVKKLPLWRKSKMENKIVISASKTDSSDYASWFEELKLRYRSSQLKAGLSVNRELLLNAVVHRDYMNPTPIQIKVYKDKIRIWNIGELPKEIKIETLFEEHASIRRNPNIANVFFKGGYIESWGRGYKNIIEECHSKNARIPEPVENSGGIAVVCLASEKYIQLAKKLKLEGFSDANMNEDCTVNCTVNCTVICPDVAKKTYLAMKENPHLSVPELSDKLGISVRTVKNHQKILKELKLIERVGADKNGFWKVFDGEIAVVEGNGK